PCAQLAAPHGRLLGPRSVHDGVTVALAGPL
ncbi:TPA: cobalamin biosynthesis protein CbiG, partial [Burkholderia dolosa]